MYRQAVTRLVQEGEQLAATGNRQEAAVRFQAAYDLQPPSDTLLYVWIPAGEFVMGSSGAIFRPTRMNFLSTQFTSMASGSCAPR